MAKHKRKVDEKLEARRKAWDALHDKQGTTRPGSRSLKKQGGKRRRKS